MLLMQKLNRDDRILFDVMILCTVMLLQGCGGEVIRKANASAALSRI